MTARRTLLLNICNKILHLFQGFLINGMINVVISTLETRFGLRSVVSGQIAGFYDLGSLLTVIPVTYFGGRPSASKPR